MLAEVADVDLRILLATETCVSDFGFNHVTVAEVARRARVSRPTIYRRWHDVHALLDGVFVRRIIEAVSQLPDAAPTLDAVVARAVAMVSALRRDPVVNAALAATPELGQRRAFQPMDLFRLAPVDQLATELRAGQGGGGVRDGDTRRMAAMLIVVMQSAMQSAIAVSEVLDDAALDAELAELMYRYLG